MLVAENRKNEFTYNVQAIKIFYFLEIHHLFML